MDHGRFLAALNVTLKTTCPKFELNRPANMAARFYSRSLPLVEAAKDPAALAVAEPSGTDMRCEIWQQ